MLLTPLDALYLFCRRYVRLLEFSVVRAAATRRVLRYLKGMRLKLQIDDSCLYLQDPLDDDAASAQTEHSTVPSSDNLLRGNIKYSIRNNFFLETNVSIYWDRLGKYLRRLLYIEQMEL